MSSRPSRPAPSAARPRGKGPSSSTGNAIRILVVDDHPLVREGLAARIGFEADMTICGEAESPHEALEKIESTRPDVVIVDLGLKRGHGLQLIREIRRRKLGTRILVLSAYNEELFGKRAVRLGAHGYINKQRRHADVTSAIRRIAAGKRFLSDALAERLLDDALGAAGTGTLTDILSDRELQVFELIGEGNPTRVIAEKLNLSTHTIETHRENIRTKLSLKNGSELVRQAVQWVIESR